MLRQRGSVFGHISLWLNPEALSQGALGTISILTLPALVWNIRHYSGSYKTHTRETSPFHVCVHAFPGTLGSALSLTYPLCPWLPDCCVDLDDLHTGFDLSSPSRGGLSLLESSIFCSGRLVCPRVCLWTSNGIVLHGLGAWFSGKEHLLVQRTQSRGSNAFWPPCIPDTHAHYICEGKTHWCT